MNNFFTEAGTRYLIDRVFFKSSFIFVDENQSRLYREGDFFARFMHIDESLLFLKSFLHHREHIG
jgi:hypothetical protein